MQQREATQVVAHLTQIALGRLRGGSGWRAFRVVVKPRNGGYRYPLHEGTRRDKGRARIGARRRKRQLLRAGLLSGFEVRSGVARLLRRARLNDIRAAEPIGDAPIGTLAGGETLGTGWNVLFAWRGERRKAHYYQK
jgi:hypothetical protein